MPRRSLPLMIAVGLVGAAAFGVDLHSLGASLDRFVSDAANRFGLEGPARSSRASAPSSINADRIYVYDGDTIIVDEQRMRLLGIGTPEISEPRCHAEETRGYQARDRLRKLIEAASTIEIVDSGERDKYRRPLIHLVMDGRDAGRALMAEGLAVEWRPGPDAWSERRRHWCGR